MAPRVPLLDLSVTDPAERAEYLEAIDAMLRHGRIVLGPEVTEFERRVAAYCGRKHCIGVGTGTDALVLGIKALGIGPGDEVISTPLSWLASGSAILLNGATAVFADIGEDLNLDPATIEPLITPRTKAILVVHFAGKAARMAEIMAIARRHGLAVIEDCAQAFGAARDGTRVGGWGDVACVSLNAMKVLAGLGDAGVVLTDDDAMAERLNRLRHSGVVNRETCVELSHNCRLDTLQAAVLLKRLDRFDHWVDIRRENARRYDQALGHLVAVPAEEAGCRDVYYTYQIKTERRDALRDHLTEAGIETRIQHPVVMNDQPAFQSLSRGDSPRARRLVERILCLPVTEKLTVEQQDYVIATVRNFLSP